MMIPGHEKCQKSVLYGEDWPLWVNGCKVADFDGNFGHLNLEIEKWWIMQKMCKIVQEIWWSFQFLANSRGFLRIWEKLWKNRQKRPKRSGRSGVPDFNGNFGIFIFEIERWSEKVKRRKLSKEFDGIKIFWKFWEGFWENQKNWKIPFWTKWPISQFWGLTVWWIFDILWAMGPIFTIEKILGPFLGRKIKSEKNWKMKILRSAAPSQNFLKISKAANFLDNFAPLILSKLFSTVVFWCLKVSWKNRTFPGFSGKKVPEN